MNINDIDGAIHQMPIKAAQKYLHNEMEKQNYSLESAIEILKAQYEVAKDYEFVNQPVAYSLYQVWRLFNEFEPPKHTP